MITSDQIEGAGRALAEGIRKVGVEGVCAAVDVQLADVKYAVEQVCLKKIIACKGELPPPGFHGTIEYTLSHNEKELLDVLVSIGVDVMLLGMASKQGIYSPDPRKAASLN